ncbi:bifunctional 4-hydroxy-2-oxoglutarate aldolase/2-dehydro-3-deoxy-phosphogluconate aldolase [Pseudonocardia spinosispora]|uniref:bifunctional 4-hydroxy-2-oxoglutarate aldolase/2-dehydro-3-deoxy-phosphogluconate aldolase n=1 Tax=Pseudonocardia spinosispora TaxID=103441 RepID=UPI00055D2587|nr:bifunctional 4-hydroxy-2-oxoglutarate aldolase/2-dehydro-3-deoxy-phosphogluconate aldolase [Pseudonocardia spinosispora]
MNILTDLYQQAVLPVLRSPSWQRAVDTVTALTDAGCPVVELTTSTPDWDTALGAVAGRPCQVGVGTIRSVEEAEKALASGAAFLVSPFPVDGVAALASAEDVPFIQGGFTPGELSGARSAGIAKVFPAHLGGPRYLRSLAPVLPELRLVPTGGIGWDDVSDYLAAGAFAVGIGSGLDLPSAELAAAFARVRREPPV